MSKFSSVDILAIRRLIDRVAEKFGNNSTWLELYPDGSGDIMCLSTGTDYGISTSIAEFDGLGELAEILE